MNKSENEMLDNELSTDLSTLSTPMWIARNKIYKIKKVYITIFAINSTTNFIKDNEINLHIRYWLLDA